MKRVLALLIIFYVIPSILLAFQGNFRLFPALNTLGLDAIREAFAGYEIRSIETVQSDLTTTQINALGFPAWSQLWCATVTAVDDTGLEWNLPYYVYDELASDQFVVRWTAVAADIAPRVNLNIACRYPTWLDSLWQGISNPLMAKLIEGFALVLGAVTILSLSTKRQLSGVVRLLYPVVVPGILVLPVILPGVAAIIRAVQQETEFPWLGLIAVAVLCVYWLLWAAPAVKRELDREKDHDKVLQLGSLTAFLLLLIL